LKQEASYDLRFASNAQHSHDALTIDVVDRRAGDLRNALQGRVRVRDYGANARLKAGCCASFAIKSYDRNFPRLGP
jgi:hypothetical protein